LRFGGANNLKKIAHTSENKNFFIMIEDPKSSIGCIKQGKYDG
jgi:hypothetical protein